MMKKDFNKKIGIVTLHGNNFGSLLQLFSLIKVLEDEGYRPELIECKKNKFTKILNLFYKTITILYQLFRCNERAKRYVFYMFHKRINNRFIFTNEMANKFIKENIPYVEKTYMEWKKESRGNYLFFIAGSDQIWNTMKIVPDKFDYLQFAPISKRFTYAPSFGTEEILPYEEALIKKYIKSIKCLSVREESGRDIIERITGIKVPVLIDPVLLISRDRWEGYCKNLNAEISKKYCFLYFIDLPRNDILDNCIDYCYAHNCSICDIINGDTKIQIPSSIDKKPSTPFEFINYIMNSEFIITDSFHAIIFSIIFNKPFWAIQRNYNNGQDQSSRIRHLLKKIDLEERYILLEKNDSIPDDYSISHERYITINNILNKEREKALNYIDSFNKQINK